MRDAGSMDPIAALREQYTVVDLSHALEEGMPAHPSHSRYFHELWESYWHGDLAVAYQLLLNEHSGTHVDAPAHFMRDGHPHHTWIDELPPTSLWGRAVTINVSETPPATYYGLPEVESFESSHGPIQEGDIVLFNTGWASKWALRPDSSSYLHGWPGPSRDLCEWLRDRKVRAVGCDNLGMDADIPGEYVAHLTFLGAGIPIIENLTNLDRMEPIGLFMATPLKIAGGSGSPLRALGFVPRP